MVTGFEDLLNAVKGPSPEALRRATLETFTEYHVRIFELGKNSAGEPIGEYSKKAIYVSLESSPKAFDTRGKKKRSGQNFKNGNPRKSGYFPGGYKQYKDTIRGDGGFVNLQLTENLKRGTVPDASPGRYVFGFTNETEYQKSKGNEEHFKNKIFDPTQAEEDLFVRLLLKYT